MLITRKGFWLAILSFAVTGSLTFPAKAGVISQFTEISSYQRSCPGLADPNFSSNWGAAIKTIYEVESFGTDIACHFNGSFQRNFYNADGSPKRPGLPAGVPYTLAEVGTTEAAIAFGANNAEIGSIDGDFYGKVTLDADNLGLPEIKIKSSSDALERNSVNGFAATEYQWLGAAQTLSYSVNFDFFNSYALWGIPGATEVHDYSLGLTFGVSQDMEFSYDVPFNFDFGNVQTTAAFMSHMLEMIDSDLENPFMGSLTINFDVDTGDKFWLWTQVQAFGLNGGFIDATHTVTSALAVEGLSQEESKRLFATDLRQVPNQIPLPSGLVWWFTALLLLCWKRRKIAIRRR
ncbi:hypothetical protein EOE67_13290 [Rheinheimera riviphila]|uniref:PEP-CTERM sorting domain-containing protein n=1 Tax=Rheinheimera riviphila TaxID=1834037 RepID=A0A437QM22_9GAMM|nr:hypothetical protein [Rheinheimera riviphila]RVU35563.1 hypothetical protein EOE67_13290 [Rheinheimera riviphila]